MRNLARPEFKKSIGSSALRIGKHTMQEKSKLVLGSHVSAALFNSFQKIREFYRRVGRQPREPLLLMRPKVIGIG